MQLGALGQGGEAGEGCRPAATAGPSVRPPSTSPAERAQQARHSASLSSCRSVAPHPDAIEASASPSSRRAAAPHPDAIEAMPGTLIVPTHRPRHTAERAVQSPPTSDGESSRGSLPHGWDRRRRGLCTPTPPRLPLSARNWDCPADTQLRAGGCTGTTAAPSQLTVSSLARSAEGRGCLHMPPVDGTKDATAQRTRFAGGSAAVDTLATSRGRHVGSEPHQPRRDVQHAAGMLRRGGQQAGVAATTAEAFPVAPLQPSPHPPPPLRRPSLGLTVTQTPPRPPRPPTPPQCAAQQPPPSAPPPTQCRLCRGAAAAHTPN